MTTKSTTFLIRILLLNHY